MNRKQIIPIVLVLLAGGGIYFWSHHAHQNETDAPEETPPTIVTVRVGPLRRATLHGYVTGYGTVGPAPAAGLDPAATARVAPPVAGVVKQVLVTEGSAVGPGTLLVELEDRVAQVAVKTAQESAERQKTLYAEKNTSLKNLQEAEAQLATAQAQLSMLHVTAPLAGTITHLNVHAGEAVDLTTVLAEITDLNRLVVSAEIPSAESTRLKVGQPMELLGEKRVVTTVSYVSPAVDSASDTVTVRAPLPADNGWRSGMTAPVRITTIEHAEVLAAPAESVVTNSAGHSVIAVVKGDEATQVQVVTGLSDGPLVEVSGEGLKPDDQVVTVGAYGLPEKTKVTVAKSDETSAR